MDCYEESALFAMYNSCSTIEGAEPARRVANMMLPATLRIPKAQSFISLPQALAEAKTDALKRSQSTESLQGNLRQWCAQAKATERTTPKMISVPSPSSQQPRSGKRRRKKNTTTSPTPSTKLGVQGGRNTRPRNGAIRRTSLLATMARKEPIPSWITIDTRNVDKLVLATEITERDRIHHNHRDLMPLSDVAMILSNRTNFAISKGLFDPVKRLNNKLRKLGEVGTSSTYTSTSTLHSNALSGWDSPCNLSED